MDFEDNEEQEEEMGLHEDAVYDSPPPPPPPPPHHHPPPSSGNSSRFKRMGSPETAGTTAGGGLMVVRSGGRPRYRECLKNQAVSIGGHAVDGCCEFMPAGPDGSIDALKCAACGCHRNFHRKETADFSLYPHAPPQGYYRLPPPVGYVHQRGPPPPPPSQAPPLQLALPPPPPPPQMRERGGGGGGGGEDDDCSGGGGRRRFRTKFTAEQKERMLGLAERIGWRIQRQDEELVQQFCEETGVSRQVLKVWLHNNKHTLGKRLPHQEPPPPPPPPSHLHHND